MASPEPITSSVLDFDASGTLFLDEVVNIGREAQGLLLQAHGGSGVASPTHRKAEEVGWMPLRPQGLLEGRGLATRRFKLKSIAQSCRTILGPIPDALEDVDSRRRAKQAHCPTTMTRLIDLDQILTLVPFSKSTIRRKLRNGEFPPPLLLWGKHVWEERTVEDWLASQVSSKP